jgi:hypothetical protein
MGSGARTQTDAAAAPITAALTRFLLRITLVLFPYRGTNERRRSPYPRGSASRIDMALTVEVAIGAVMDDRGLDFGCGEGLPASATAEEITETPT